MGTFIVSYFHKNMIQNFKTPKFYSLFICIGKINKAALFYKNQ